MPMVKLIRCPSCNCYIDAATGESVVVPGKEIVEVVEEVEEEVVEEVEEKDPETRHLGEVR